MRRSSSARQPDGIPLKSQRLAAAREPLATPPSDMLGYPERAGEQMILEYLTIGVAIAIPLLGAAIVLCIADAMLHT